jgi:hypothetical protein
LLHLVLPALLLTADADFVYFRGKALPEMCPFRTAFAIPCPTCGMTRGAVLALHGRLGESAAVNASAPVLVGAVLLLGVLLMLAGIFRMTGRDRGSDVTAKWIHHAGVAGGAAWMVLMAVNWVWELRAVLR